MPDLSRRDFMRQALWTGTLGIQATRTQARPQGLGQQADKPNVLLIMTDTQRLDDMGAYGNGVIRTPHLDKLARTGVMFRNCHTQYPACMPARATIFTGRYPMAHGVWSNGVTLPEHEVTLAQVFAEHGYRTGGAGKFHFQPHFPYRKSKLPLMETHPEPYYGFQEFHLGEDGRSGEQCVWIKRNHSKYYAKPDHLIPVELHNSHWTATHTIDFIRSCVKGDRPFFAFCSFVDPHQGYNPPPPYSTMYKESDMPEPIRKEGELDHSRFKSVAEKPNMKRHTERVETMRAQHYGEMSLIDDSVGRVIDTLKELNIQDNTLIVFVSDHGDMLGDHWLWWKGPWHYAGCTCVPLFFHWPGKLQAGKAVDGMVQQTDVFPTLCELAGLSIPAGVQGKSLKPVLTTRTSETPYDYAYIESVDSGAYTPTYRDNYGKPRKKPAQAPIDTVTVRSRKWRFTVFTGMQNGELYDLQADPHEFTNLFHDRGHAAVKAELMAVLLDRMAQTRDPLPLRTKPY